MASVLGHESLGKLDIFNLVLAFIGEFHELDVIDLKAYHLDDAHKVLDIYLTGPLFINNSTKFNDLLYLALEIVTSSKGTS